MRQPSVQRVSKRLPLLYLRLYKSRIHMRVGSVGVRHTRALMLLLATPLLAVDDVIELVPFDSRDL